MLLTEQSGGGKLPRVSWGEEEEAQDQKREPPEKTLKGDVIDRHSPMGE